MDHAHLDAVGTAALTAFGVGMVLQPIAIAALSRYEVLDVPNARSSHRVAIPRGGGLVVALAVVAGIALVPDTWPLCLPLLAFAALGLAEDISGVAVPARLGLQLLTGALIGYAIAEGGTRHMPMPVALPLVLGCALWTAGYVNAFNFMDGLDGMAGANAAAAATAYCLLGLRMDVPILIGGGLITAAAAASFLPYNAVRARIFLGDVGSYALGGLLATLAGYALVNGAPVEAALGPTALYLADTGWTLLRRIRSGEIWYQAHRTHAYQRLTDLGWSHQRVTAICAALTAGTGACGLAATAGDIPLRVGADLVALLAIGAYLCAPTWLGQRRPTQPSKPSGVPVR